MIAHTIARFAPPIRRSSVRCSVLCATLGLAFAVLATAAAGQTAAAGEARAEDHSPQSFHGKVGAEVSRVLARDGRAPVIVALAQPQTRPVHRRRIPALVAEVGAMQRAVLDPLQPGDFQATHVYSVVPALAGWTTPAGLERLARHPYVLRVGVDRPVRAALAESVPHIGADRWHDEGIQENGVTVAVLDSGVDTAHADLSGALVAEECFLERAPGKCPDGTGRQSGPGAAADNDGHGTHVSGIVLSSAGVSPGASLAALKVTDDDGNGAVSDLVAALEFILTDLPDVQVINMSLGTPTTFAAECDDEDADNRTLAWILNVLRALGVTPIAASGNHTSQTSMASPACLSGVVSVGATDKQDGVASFTNVSPELDLMAPGVGIESSGLGGGTDTKSGTSMAAPHASGCAALLLQSGFATTPEEVEAWLTTSQVSVQAAGQEFPRLECLPPDHHLTFYRLEPSAGPLDWVVQVENQFGVQELQIGDPALLAVPTQKEPHEAPVGLDHYKCYNAFGLFIAADLLLTDQFQADGQLSDLFPILFCNPVQKTHGDAVTEIRKPGEHLVCYFAELPILLDPPVTRSLSNQFNTWEQELEHANVLCVPSIDVSSGPDSTGTLTVCKEVDPDDGSLWDFTLHGPTQGFAGLTTPAAPRPGTSAAWTWSGTSAVCGARDVSGSRAVVGVGVGLLRAFADGTRRPLLDHGPEAASGPDLEAVLEDDPAAGPEGDVAFYARRWDRSSATPSCRSC